MQGSATDCQHWDWSMMAGQFITTPYTPATDAPELLRLAQAAGAHLLHSPLGSATEALIPHLPSAAARAPFVAHEAATVLHSTGAPWAGTVLVYAACSDYAYSVLYAGERHRRAGFVDPAPHILEFVRHGGGH